MRHRSILASAIVAATVLSGVPAAATVEGRPAPPVAAVERAGDSPSERVLAAPIPCEGCWVPDPSTTWQWQLQGRIDTSVDVEMLDLDGFETPASTVRDLHDAGRAVVCYLSAGSWEEWRPDAAGFPRSVLGASNGWPGERWLDIRRLGVLRPIMRARIDLCAARGFDAVEFDNVDGYQNRTGFPLRPADQLRYNVYLANQAHKSGLAALLKNDLGQIHDLLPYFDAALNEQCFQYDECGRLRPFVTAGKAVFTVEYRMELHEFCPRSAALGFNSLKKKMALGVWRRACPGGVAAA